MFFICYLVNSAVSSPDCAVAYIHICTCARAHTHTHTVHWSVSLPYGILIWKKP